MGLIVLDNYDFVVPSKKLACHKFATVCAVLVASKWRSLITTPPKRYPRGLFNE